MADHSNQLARRIGGSIDARKTKPRRWWASRAARRCAAAWFCRRRWRPAERRIRRARFRVRLRAARGASRSAFRPRGMRFPSWRRARREYKRSGRGGAEVESAPDKRLAFHQIAQRLLDAFTCRGIVGFVDRAGFATEFEAEEQCLSVHRGCRELGDRYLPQRRRRNSTGRVEMIRAPARPAARGRREARPRQRRQRRWRFEVGAR